MAGDNEDFKSTDERIGDMFSSAIAPLPDPDQAFINRALVARDAAAMSSGGAGSPAAAVSPTATSEAEPWYKRMARDAAAGEMRSGKAAEDTVASMPTSDTDSEALQKKIEGENKPLQSRDSQGKVLPEYQPSLGRKILRGLAGAGRGLMEGGVPGLAEGAIDPSSTYSQNDPRRQYAGYGAPNKAYQTAEGNRQRDVTADTANLDMAQKRFKEATDRMKARAQEERSVATTYKDAGATANKAESDATAAQKEQDAANKVVDPKTEDELALALSKARQAGDKQKVALYQGALDEIKRVKISERAPKDTTAADIAKAIQVSEFRTREIGTIDKAKEDERNKRYAELDKNVTIKYDQAKMGAEKQRIDAELDAKYAPKYDDIHAQADQMLGLTKAGAKLKSGASNTYNTNNKNNQKPQAAAQPSTAKPSQQPSTPPASLWKGKEGKILTLKDPTGGQQSDWKLVNGTPQRLGQ